MVDSGEENGIGEVAKKSMLSSDGLVDMVGAIVPLIEPLILDLFALAGAIGRDRRTEGGCNRDAVDDGEIVVEGERLGEGDWRPFPGRAASNSAVHSDEVEVKAAMSNGLAPSEAPSTGMEDPPSSKDMMMLTKSDTPILPSLLSQRVENDPICSTFNKFKPLSS